MYGVETSCGRYGATAPGELYRLSTNEDGHFGVKRAYDTIASKYYCIIQCETTCNFTFVGIIDIFYMIVPSPIGKCM